MPEPLIALERVRRTFSARGRRFAAVEDVSLAVQPAEVLCLVGESACGKTTTGKLMAGLLRPSEGRVLYRGRDVAGLRGGDWKRYRLDVQLIHQDPFASLNPALRVADTIEAPIRHHGIARGARACRELSRELLESVDLTPADEILGKFPHQLSGGQRQRVSIARALTVRPSFLVADEAVSMVDVSIRVSLLDTLRRLRDAMGLAVLFITHDLALARYFAGDAGRIGVMYMGRIAEIGPAAELVRRPRHPYTQALLGAAPRPNREAPVRIHAALRSSDVPSIVERPSGCALHPRCPIAEPGLCDSVVPELRPLGEAMVACHLALPDGRADLTDPGRPARIPREREGG